MKFLELKIPPVIQVVIFGGAMWMLAIALPNLQAPIPARLAFATVFIAIGLAVALLGVLEFRKAKTTVDPRFPNKTTRLVVGGVFRISRNPMYLGFFLVLFGWAYYLMNYLAFLLLPLFVLYMNRFQIQPEERHMAEKFGDEFNAYAARVRRWI